MTNEEFKAWFDGFSEGIDGVPTVTQWNKIKSKIKEIGPTQVYDWSKSPYTTKFTESEKPWWERNTIAYMGGNPK